MRRGQKERAKRSEIGDFIGGSRQSRESRWEKSSARTRLTCGGASGKELEEPERGAADLGAGKEQGGSILACTFSWNIMIIWEPGGSTHRD